MLCSIKGKKIVFFSFLMNFSITYLCLKNICISRIGENRERTNPAVFSIHPIVNSLHFNSQELVSVSEQEAQPLVYIYYMAKV